MRAIRISRDRDSDLTFSRVREVADFIILSAGWRRRGIAFLAGACGALAMAPVDFFPAMIIPMTVSVWLIDGATPTSRRDGFGGAFAAIRDAAGAGWWLGFGYFAAGLWWIGAALLVDANEFAWALPLAVLGLPAVLALFTALGFGLARAIWSARGARILALAAGLGASEWLRGVVATGFPWNDFGMALGGNIALAQMASIVGLHGLTVLAVGVFASPATLIDGRFEKARRRWFSRLSAAPTLGIAAFAVIAIFGALRLSTGPVGSVAGVQLRLMQPNIEQGPAFRPENKTAILDRYLALSDRATSPQITGVADVTHLIWPESAFPFILSRDAAALGRITSFLGPKTILITGAARMADGPAARSAGSDRRFYNSVQAMDREHGIFANYDKIHLVPFGEYLPLGDVLERLGVRRLVSVPGGFQSGGPRKYMSVPGLPAVSALVCYEAVFSGEVTSHGDGRERPGLLLNVSEDGWYDHTAGPYQHFSHARLRSIEEGLPLVRAANTGISAIVDPYGRVIGYLPPGVEAVLDGPLPKTIDPTFFSKWPLVGGLLLLVAALSGALLGRWRTR
jgi:apolipoprotein N-acyltransferase